LLLLRRLTFLRFFDLFLLSASCLGFGLLLPVLNVLIRVDDTETPFWRIPVTPSPTAFASNHLSAFDLRYFSTPSSAVSLGTIIPVSKIL